MSSHWPCIADLGARFPREGERQLQAASDAGTGRRASICGSTRYSYVTVITSIPDLWGFIFSLLRWFARYSLMLCWFVYLLRFRPTCDSMRNVAMLELLDEGVGIRHCFHTLPDSTQSSLLLILMSHWAWKISLVASRSSISWSRVTFRRTSISDKSCHCLENSRKRNFGATPLPNYDQHRCMRADDLIKRRKNILYMLTWVWYSSGANADLEPLKGDHQQ